MRQYQIEEVFKDKNNNRIRSIWTYDTEFENRLAALDLILTIFKSHDFLLDQSNQDAADNDDLYQQAKQKFAGLYRDYLVNGTDQFDFVDKILRFDSSNNVDKNIAFEDTVNIRLRLILDGDDHLTKATIITTDQKENKERTVLRLSKIYQE